MLPSALAERVARQCAAEAAAAAAAAAAGQRDGTEAAHGRINSRNAGKRRVVLSMAGLAALDARLWPRRCATSGKSSGTTCTVYRALGSWEGSSVIILRKTNCPLVLSLPVSSVVGSSGNPPATVYCNNKPSFFSEVPFEVLVAAGSLFCVLCSLAAPPLLPSLRTIPHRSFMECPVCLTLPEGEVHQCNEVQRAFPKNPHPNPNPNPRP